MSLKDSVNLCEERVYIVLCAAADFVFVEADLRHFRQDPGSCLRANAEERAAVHGEN